MCCNSEHRYNTAGIENKCQRSNEIVLDQLEQLYSCYDFSPKDDESTKLCICSSMQINAVVCNNIFSMYSQALYSSLEQPNNRVDFQGK